MKNLFATFLLLVLVAVACGSEPSSPARSATPAAASPAAAPARSARSYERWAGATVPVPSFPPARPIQALWDTYYLGAAIGLIDGATEEIELVQFQFTYGPSVGRIQEALGRAVDRGVRVRVLLDEEPPGSGRSIPHLIKRGIEAKLDGTSRTRTHTKLILADRRRALFGSTNLSDNSINNNHETDLLIDDVEIGAALARYAAELWRDAERSIEIEPVRIDGLELHFDRSFEAALMGLMDGAQRRIDIQMYATKIYPDNPASPSTAAFNALRRAAARGVAVRVLLERGEDNDWGRVTNDLNDSTVRFLQGSGIEIRFDPPQVISHAKLLLVDDAATVGSMNWGYGGFRLYHELNTIVRDSAAVSDLENYFETIWSRGKP